MNPSSKRILVFTIAMMIFAVFQAMEACLICYMLILIEAIGGNDQ